MALISPAGMATHEEIASGLGGVSLTNEKETHPRRAADVSNIQENIRHRQRGGFGGGEWRLTGLGLALRHPSGIV